MANVKTVQDSGDTAALLVLDEGSKPIWTPDRELARTLLGKPIPADWLVKPNKQNTGYVALPPKKGGGGGGYRQSKEAFESEARSRTAWQQVEEERRDKRAALGRAVELADDALDAIQYADIFYEWLRASPPEQNPGREAAPGDRGRQGGDTTSGPVAGEEASAMPNAQDPDPAASGEGEAPGEGSGGQSNPPGSTNEGWWPPE